MKTFEYWLARFVLATLSATSLATANRLARIYVRILDVAIPRLRRTALKNLEMAGLAGRERITDRRLRLGCAPGGELRALSKNYARDRPAMDPL